MNFVSDNIVGASRPVLEAVVEANNGAQAAYGADEITKRVAARFADIFEREVAVFPVTTGTAANALALAAAIPPSASASAIVRRTPSTTNAARRNSSPMAPS
jgi:threonine aldolase